MTKFWNKNNKSNLEFNLLTIYQKIAQILLVGLMAYYLLKY